MENIKSLAQGVDMSTGEKSLWNNNKYKVLFLKKLMMAPEPYLDVLIIDNYYEIPKETQQPIREETPREIQAELRSFC